MRTKRIDPALYVFLIPCLAYVVVFNYAPLYGLQIAFRDFKASAGIWNSQWVGLKHFIRFAGSYHFSELIGNTLSLTIYALLAGFPIPILLSLFLNYCTLPSLKKATQTLTYAPHFISTVVMVGMILVFLGKNGPVNSFLSYFGVPSIGFMGVPAFYQSIYVWSGIWQNAGWSSIIYIATLSGISPELHEAAMVDGASKLQRIAHIDLPALMGTATILLILNIGTLMTVGFEKSFLLQNDVNLPVSEVISTYVYKTGILGSQFSYATAINLFNNIINFLLLLGINRIAKAKTENSLW